MKFAIVSGSHRPQSQSGKVARFVQRMIQEVNPSHSSYLLDLGRTPLPFWDEGMWTGADSWKQSWGAHSAEIKSADALVIVSPEWAGMVPAGLKNFFLLCSKQEVAHKPALIVTVSAGATGGAYPVAELRTSSYKNTFICYLPEHVIIRNVESLLNDWDKEANDSDSYIRRRLRHGLVLLESYGKALKSVRDANVFDFKAYPHGM
jgi:NAD(P)H-dependent FMN reductase